MGQHPLSRQGFYILPLLGLHRLLLWYTFSLDLGQAPFTGPIAVQSMERDSGKRLGFRWGNLGAQSLDHPALLA